MNIKHFTSRELAKKLYIFNSTRINYSSPLQTQPRYSNKKQQLVDFRVLKDFSK